jgi:threonylcarbamoyladenosine tRNA methylthiotransferase MtaB
MAELFKAAGFCVADFDDVCDVYVINTCTVTSMGDKKSRQMIRRAKAINPDAVVAVTGCYSQVAPEEIAKTGADIILGNKSKNKIVDFVLSALEDKIKTEQVEDILRERTFEDMRISAFDEKTRAFVKIEDGCNSFCTYCIIPFARGPVRSRDIESIVSEVESLAAVGYSEVVLTGIHIASYGMDIKDKDINLLTVIKAVHNVDGIERIRLGSIEPRILTEDFVKELSHLPKVCNHFHISLQSGCDDTLKRMNRKYDTAHFRQVVENIRKYIPDSAITTDIMVGFPGETDEEFEASVNFLKEIAFAEAHVFAYSNRKGTKADKFEGQVKKEVKNRRAGIMAKAAEGCRDAFLESFVGKTVKVLAEREIDGGVFEGHTSNYITVQFESETDVAHRYIDVKITKAEKGICHGTIE